MCRIPNLRLKSFNVKIKKERPKIEEFNLAILNLFHDRILQVVEEDALAVPQDGRVQSGLEMNGLPFVIRPLASDTLALEVDWKHLSVDLRQLLHLQLEPWDGVALAEMLSNRVADDSPSACAAQLRRRGRSQLLHEHQHIAVLDAWVQEAQLHGQGMPLPDTYVPRQACFLIVEELLEILDVKHLLGMVSPPPVISATSAFAI